MFLDLDLDLLSLTSQTLFWISMSAAASEAFIVE